MSAPLAGLVVADFSRVLSGPLPTMLGDLGADVIKVEHPVDWATPGPEARRSWTTQAPTP